MSVAPPVNSSLWDPELEANATVLAPLSVPYTISEVLVAVVAVLGNALTITVFVVERKLRRRTNYYIVSLALADLLVGVFGIPFAILTSIGLPRPLWACLFMLSTLLILCTVSIFCLLAVSVDRYWAILYPLPYSRLMTARIARRIILACWVAGTVVGLLPVMGWYNTTTNYKQLCLFVKVMSYNYLVFIYFGTIVGPGILMAAFYAHIYSVVLKQLRQIAAQEPQADAASVGTQSSQRQRSNIFRSQSRGQVSESSRYDPHRASTNTNLANQVTHASRREVKAAKSLSIIVLFFMISWFPLYTINCVQAFCKTCTVSESFMYFTIILTHLNSAINPFLYAYHMQDFRLALKAFIAHRILRRPVDPDQAFHRSLASLHHHSTVHRVNVADSPYLTNLHTPRSHNSPVSGSPLPGMSIEGIRSRSSTLGSFGPWDSYKGLSASVSFPSSPAFTTSSSVIAHAHASELSSHRPQTAALNSLAGSAPATNALDSADESSQPLLSSGVMLCVPPTHHTHTLHSSATSHSGSHLPHNQQPQVTNAAASVLMLAEMCDVADVTVILNSPKWSVGPDQYEESPTSNVSGVAVRGDGLPGEPVEVNCSEGQQTADDVKKAEPENLFDGVDHAYNTTLTGVPLHTDDKNCTQYTSNGSIGRVESPLFPADSSPLPLAPTASIESLQDSPCNGMSKSGLEGTDVSSGDEETPSQTAFGRMGSHDVEVRGAADVNHGKTLMPSLFSNGRACGVTQGSPENSLSSPTFPAAPGPETLIPRVTESEPSLLSRELSKYLPKILRRREGGQRSRVFRLRNWWSNDSRQKSSHQARRARSISGAIGT